MKCQKYVWYMLICLWSSWVILNFENLFLQMWRKHPLHASRYIELLFRLEVCTTTVAGTRASITIYLYYQLWRHFVIKFWIQYLLLMLEFLMISDLFYPRFQFRWYEMMESYMQLVVRIHTRLNRVHCFIQILHTATKEYLLESPKKERMDFISMWLTTCDSMWLTTYLCPPTWSVQASHLCSHLCSLYGPHDGGPVRVFGAQADGRRIGAFIGPLTISIGPIWLKLSPKWCFLTLLCPF